MLWNGRVIFNIDVLSFAVQGRNGVFDCLSFFVFSFFDDNSVLLL